MELDGSEYLYGIFFFNGNGSAYLFVDYQMDGVYRLSDLVTPTCFPRHCK